MYVSGYLKCGDAIAVLFVVEPLAFVSEAVRAFADTETGAFVVLPLAHVGLGHAGIQMLILTHEKMNFSIDFGE
jgi:hypothetical protein